MNQQKITTGFVLIGSILFHTFFWSEKLGLNVLLFTIFILGALYFIKEDRTYSKYAIFTIICTFLLAVIIVVNNSLLSKTMYGISLTAMIGFVHQKELSHFFYGIFQSVLNLESVPKKMFGKKNSAESFIGNWQLGWTYFRISILPLIIFGVFYFLYAAANPKFAEISTHTINWFSSKFDWNISFESFVFFFIGFYIVGTIIWKSEIAHLVRFNKSHNENLIRQKKQRAYAIKNPKMLSLKNEFRTALIMMGMLNVLLFLVNIIDIRFVWFEFQDQPAHILKNYVHEGTYLLIASILLAMGIIIFYFRGNLNFYIKNKPLQYLTYAWIFQNAILAYSVGMRNYRYIEYHGLAYKRIGVMIFLIAVIYGLITMFKKVQEKKSFYFLVNQNAWAIYTLMVIASLFNWDVAITRYNILAATKRPLDIEFLSEDVSDKNLFLLKKYHNEIADKISASPHSIYKKKLESFEQEQKNYSWLSWNYADFRNKRLLD